MSKNEEGLSLIEGGALLVEHVVPKRGTFTLIMSDTMCYQITESGRTLRLDFRRRGPRGGKVVGHRRRNAARGDDLATPCERIPALRARPLGTAMEEAYGTR